MITFHLASDVLHAASVDTSSTEDANSWRRHNWWVKLILSFAWNEGTPCEATCCRQLGDPGQGSTPVWCTPPPSPRVQDDTKPYDICSLLIEGRLCKMVGLIRLAAGKRRTLITQLAQTQAAATCLPQFSASVPLRLPEGPLTTNHSPAIWELDVTVTVTVFKIQWHWNLNIYKSLALQRRHLRMCWSA